jgi:hypothetical protein
MKNVRSQLVLLAVAGTLVWPFGSFASGSYTSRLPQPPSKAGTGAKVDRAKFDLGQKVYNGKTAPVETSAPNATAQRVRLEAVQRQLPPKVAVKKDLTTLAGKITDEQLEALEYFVKERYPASK